MIREHLEILDESRVCEREAEHAQRITIHGVLVVRSALIFVAFQLLEHGLSVFIELLAQCLWTSTGTRAFFSVVDLVEQSTMVGQGRESIYFGMAEQAFGRLAKNVENFREEVLAHMGSFAKRTVECEDFIACSCST